MKSSKKLVNKISTARWSSDETKFYDVYESLFKKYPEKFFSSLFTANVAF